MDQEPLLGSTENLSRNNQQARNQRVTLNTNLKRRKMSRRVNLIGICAVFSLCIFLLLATTQHRPSLLPASIASGGALSNSMGGQAESGYGINMQQQQQQQSLIYSYNLTAKMEDVLLAKRTKIAKEMEGFEYPNGKNGVAAKQLSDLTIETNGQPIRSIILTTWRSGSTFLGDILNALPANYYHYEPLLNFGINQVRESPDSIIAVNNLKNLLHCNYSEMEEYLIYGKSHTYLFEHNERLWSTCKEFPHFCWRAKFLTPFCRMFPLQSMKTVRLRLALAEELINDKSLNVRIILLVRDPRGTMQSRKHRDWCGGNPDCEDPSLVCSDLEADYESAEEFLKKYPTRFRTLRYEDLSMNPYEITQEVLQFYGLPFDPRVEAFLDTHTKVNIGGVSSTYRDSKSAPFHWKQDLKIDEIKNIQDSCVKAMDLWGYRRIENFTDFQGTFDPIILPPPFS